MALQIDKVMHHAHHCLHLSYLSFVAFEGKGTYAKIAAGLAAVVAVELCKEHHVFARIKNKLKGGKANG